MGQIKRSQSKAVVIGIAGGSCTGKTLLADALAEHFGKRCSILRQDHYYIDQSQKFDHDGGAVNFDHPDSIDLKLLATHVEELRSGRSIQVPQYDFKTHSRLAKTLELKSAELVIVEGTMVLTDPVVSHCDLTIFVKTTKRHQLERRIQRDTEERGRTKEGVISQFEKQVFPMHERFIHPQRQKADLVLVNDGDKSDFVQSSLAKIGALLDDSSLRA